MRKRVHSPSDPGTDDAPVVELTINSSPTSLPVVRSAVARMAQMEGFTEPDAHNVTWAIDEALANVIKHGYEGRPDQPIHITLRSIRADDGQRGLMVAVRDQGKQVDPSSIRSRDLDDLRPGGLGVHVIRTIMDEVEYSCPPTGGMLVIMKKYVPAGDPSQDPSPEARQP